MSLQLRANAEIERRKREKVAAKEAKKLEPEFYGKNKDYLNLSERESMLAGPAETGKTFTTLNKLKQLCKRTPGAQAAIVRKHKSSMYDTVLRTWEDKVLKPWDEVRKYGGEKPQWYTFPNGAKVMVIGMDDGDKALSAEKDYVYVNQAEGLELDDWQVLVTRTTGRAGNAQKVGLKPQLFGDCNPGPPNHWILERAKEVLTKIDSRHEDNPTLFDQETGQLTEQGIASISALDSLTGTRYLRLRKGLWVAAEGTVYEDDFRPDIHIIERHQLPEFKEVYRVIDFGFTNPFVCLWAGVDHDGRIYVFREWYFSRMIVEDHAKEINKYPESIRATICDHDAEDRATLERHLEISPRTTVAKKAITAGIDLVRERLRVQEDGKARLYFVKDMLIRQDEELKKGKTPRPISTIEEMSVYAYPKDASGKAVKELPVDKDNHGLDALRYLVAHLDQAPGKYESSKQSSTRSSLNTRYAGRR